MTAQMKVVSDTSETTINAVKSQDQMTSHRDQRAVNSKFRQCWNCEHTHEYHKKKLYPAYGKTCLKC